MNSEKLKNNSRGKEICENSGHAGGSHQGLIQTLFSHNPSVLKESSLKTEHTRREWGTDILQIPVEDMQKTCDDMGNGPKEFR